MLSGAVAVVGSSSPMASLAGCSRATNHQGKICSRHPAPVTGGQGLECSAIVHAIPAHQARGCTKTSNRVLTENERRIRFYLIIMAGVEPEGALSPQQPRA